MTNRKTTNGTDNSSADKTPANDDQQLVQEYLNEHDTTYAEVDVSIEHARSNVARAAKAAARLRDLQHGVAGELSQTARADLEFDLFEVNRGLRDLKRISENHCAWFLTADHDDLTQPGKDKDSEKARQRILDQLRTLARRTRPHRPRTCRAHPITTMATPRRHPVFWHLLHTDPANPQHPPTQTPTLAAVFAAQRSPAPGTRHAVDRDDRLHTRTVLHLVRWHLIDHGWLPDHRRITWVYPQAFGGADPGGLHDDRLAEYGPTRRSCDWIPTS